MVGPSVDRFGIRVLTCAAVIRIDGDRTGGAMISNRVDVVRITAFRLPNPLVSGR